MTALVVIGCAFLIFGLVFLAALCVRRRATGTWRRAPLAPPSTPDPEQVEALVDVFDAVSRHSEYGGTFPELATAALAWMHQQQGARP